jgi:hypothetical protein
MSNYHFAEPFRFKHRLSHKLLALHTLAIIGKSNSIRSHIFKL